MNPISERTFLSENFWCRQEFTSGNSDPFKIEVWNNNEICISSTIIIIRVLKAWRWWRCQWHFFLFYVCFWTDWSKVMSFIFEKWQLLIIFLAQVLLALRSKCTSVELILQFIKSIIYSKMIYRDKIKKLVH